MRKAVFIIYVSILTLFIVTSCEEDADNVRIPEFKQKMVISGFITTYKPNQYIKIYGNLGLYGNRFINPDPIQKITVSDGSLEAPLDTTRMGYVIRSSDILIGEGKTYTLRIWNSSGLAAEASCTVPFKRTFDLKADTIKTSSETLSNKYYKVSIGFNDFKGEDNYYRLACYQASYYSKPKYVTSISKLTQSDEEFFDDKGRDGIRLSSELGMTGISPGMDSSFLKIYLLNLDKPYYNFYKSIKNYVSGEDPFTEPSPVYTNVKGGLGVFASYTIDSLIFRMK
jgi:hypothetical protein